MTGCNCDYSCCWRARDSSTCQQIDSLWGSPHRCEVLVMHHCGEVNTNVFCAVIDTIIDTIINDIIEFNRFCAGPVSALLCCVSRTPPGYLLLHKMMLTHDTGPKPLWNWDDQSNDLLVASSLMLVITCMSGYQLMSTMIYCEHQLHFTWWTNKEGTPKGMQHWLLWQCLTIKEAPQCILLSFKSIRRVFPLQSYTRYPFNGLVVVSTREILYCWCQIGTGGQCWSATL